ncbi:MAG: metalloregulator ArsR/SmtB family transcription factor [Bacteroidota bacterium]|nr:metalloregulator ArsR/SmtB family transcription factor [Bacteroidota bacterium]
MDKTNNIFQTLSDPNRLRILKMLQARSLCVCEITSVLEIGTSTVSNHLSILKKDGFIIDEKEGKWVNYKINPRPADDRVSSILSTLDFWIADETSIINDKKKLANVNRITLCMK